MPSNCAVYGCFTNVNKLIDKHISVHTFPKNEDVKRKWIHLCKRADPINAKSARVCSLHFEPDAYERNLKYELLGIPLPKSMKRLKEGALPTLHLPALKGEHYYNN